MPELSMKSDSYAEDEEELTEDTGALSHDPNFDLLDTYFID